MKEGKECRLLSLLAAEEAFGLTEEEMTALLDPALYIGRCPQQVDALLSEVRPLVADADRKTEEISV